MRERPKVLIVDDEEGNIKLLKGMLVPEDYDILEAVDGKEALTSIYDKYPDLILLDVMMPQMNGFEVCATLKQEEKTRMIPVIMVTALSEREYRIKALESGADDFLSKPVDKSELLARVRSLLRIKSFHDELADSYRMIAKKNRELKALEEMKEGLTHMIIHDLKSPVAAISMGLELFIIENQGLPERQVDTIKRCLSSCSDLDNQIAGLLDIKRMEEGKLVLDKEMTNVVDLAGHVLEQFLVVINSKQISLSFPIQHDIPSLPADRKIMKRVIANLISNAIRYTPYKGQIDLTLVFDREKNSVTVSIKDSGPGLRPEYHEKIFEKFSQVKLNKQGSSLGASGLGLAFCKMAMEAHGGSIWVESEGEGRGCAFFFEIPARP